LQNEVNEPMTYFTILETISNGEHKLGNIAGKLNKNVQNITSFISKLIELEIIYKEVPVTEKLPNKRQKGNSTLSKITSLDFGSLMFYHTEVS
jgi:hypothetical protein